MRIGIVTVLLGALALMGGTGMVRAQTAIQTAATPASEVLFYKGQKLFAKQECERHPGQGVSLEVVSVTDGGERAEIRVTIGCWGAWSCLSGCGSFFGSIKREWGVVVMNFYTGTARPAGRDMLGLILNEGEKRSFQFGQSTLLTAEGQPRSGGMTFR